MRSRTKGDLHGNESVAPDPGLTLKAGLPYGEPFLMDRLPGKSDQNRGFLLFSASVQVRSQCDNKPDQEISSIQWSTFILAGEREPTSQSKPKPRANKPQPGTISAHKRH